MANTVDEELLSFYKAAAAGGKQFQGLNILQYEVHIARLIKSTGAKTLLDYGSGAGQQYTVYSLHKRWGVFMPVMYDPAVEDFQGKPRGKFDGVLCSDVLEHIPEHLLDDVIRELFSYAGMFVWVSVCCRPAKKFFPNGQNMHVTVKPAKWWRKKMGELCEDKSFEIVFTL